MLSDSQGGISVRSLIDVNQWQKIQNLFSEIIGANLWLIEPPGTPVTSPSKVNAYCSEFVKPTANTYVSDSDCVFKALGNWRSRKQEIFRCPHQLDYFPIPVMGRIELLGMIVVGPILLGKREETKIYETLCNELNVDADIFLDRIREIKVFSHSGMRVILDFLKELVQHVVDLAYKRRELEQLLPNFIAAKTLDPDDFFSNVYVNSLVNYLLEIATQLVHADSGSVLLIDPSEKSFSIKSARGLSEEVKNKEHIPLSSSIAGWVASEKRSVLIGGEPPGGLPRAQLKRTNIKASMLVPLEIQKKVVGIFCLNAQSANKRFNQNNLALLDQLGKLAGVALARANVN